MRWGVTADSSASASLSVRNDSKNDQGVECVREERWLLLAEEAEFAGGSVGAEIVGEMERGSDAGGDGGVGAEAAEAEEA